MTTRLEEGRAVEALGGPALKARREAAGYSRREFAPLIGIGVRTLEGWEAVAGEVPANKRKAVELWLSRPSAEVTPLNLMAFLAARLAAGDEAIRQLAALQEKHPELFVDGSLTLKGDDLSTVEVKANEAFKVPPTPGEGVMRGRRRPAPRHRIKGDDGD